MNTEILYANRMNMNIMNVVNIMHIMNTEIFYSSRKDMNIMNLSSPATRFPVKCMSIGIGKISAP